MKRLARGNVFALFVLLLAAGCDQSCPAGYQLFENSCILASGGAAGDTGSVGGQSSDVGAAGTAGSGASCDVNTFGQACMSVADCGCDTDYCAGYPGQQGVCTHTGCLSNPAICPAQWGCMDLSTFQPGLPSICSPPQ